MQSIPKGGRHGQGAQESGRALPKCPCGTAGPVPVAGDAVPDAPLSRAGAPYERRLVAIPVLVITGFLGCGKTSLLRHLLPLCGEAGLRPALIINEVGDVDVDGQLLADLHAEQARLVGGCVCCTLQAQLAETLYDLLDRQAADLILIECSGLSNPVDVLTALSTPALVPRIAISHILCLLDAGRARKVLQATELARAQVSTADVLVLNKADIVAASERAAVEALAAEHAPNATALWASYGDLGPEPLRKILTDPAPTRCHCGHDHAHDHDHDHAPALPDSFCTVAVRLPDEVTRPALEGVLAALPANVLRAKGFANVAGEGWQVLHRVCDSVEISPLGSRAPSVGAVLVCIGQHLDGPSLRRSISKLVNQ